MKKSVLMLVFLFAVLPASFAKHKKAVKSNEIISVSMHRSACFGRCPDYLVELSKTGNVVYTGYMFVKDSGVYQKNIGVTAVKKIFDMCKQYRIDTCQEIYNNKIPDLPGLYYIIKYGGKTQKITNAGFGPGFLKEIAYSIDHVSTVDSTWKHKPSKTVK